MRTIYFLLLLPFSSVAQLPNPQLLQEKGITSVEIRHHNLPPQTPDSFDTKVVDAETLRPDTTPEHIATYFFNHQGVLDSTHYWHKEVFTSVHYTYNAQGNVISQRTDSKGKTIQMEEVTELPGGNLEYKRFNRGHLLEHLIARPDSVILETFPSEQQQTHYFLYAYDPDQNTALFKMISTKTGEIMAMRHERWTKNQNGEVDTVFVRFDQTKKNARTNNFGLHLDQTYALNEKGEWVPASTLNAPEPTFYNALKTSKFIRQYESFKTDSDLVIEKTEPYTAMTFEAVHPRGYYSFVYHYGDEN